MNVIRERMRAIEIGVMRFLVLAFAALCLWAPRGWAQQESPLQPGSVGKQAVSIILKHYELNPFAKKPLPADGSWTMAAPPATACPQGLQTCIEVFYEVPAKNVHCSWVLLLNAD
jgi:hypothetical protein